MIRPSHCLGLLALSALSLYAQPAQPAAVAPTIPSRLLVSAEKPEQWRGGSQDRDIVAEGEQSSIRWAHADSAALDFRGYPTDWTGEQNALDFWLHSEKATGSRFIIYIGSENPNEPGPDYYSANITLDFTGWRHYQLHLKGLGKTRSPLGFDKITSFRLNADGWGNTPHAEAVVRISNIQLVYLPPLKGPRLNDEDFFAALDLDRPGLEAVKTAVVAADYAAARAALVRYYEARQSPRHYRSWADRPAEDQRPASYNTSAADKVVAHLLSSCGVAHQFGERIDWSINPTKIQYKEWTWQLSRHPFWRTLVDAYWQTGKEVYGQEFVAQMTAWVEDNPVPVNSSGNGGGSRWRTIEAGIRTGGVWPECFFRMLGSPVFTDDAVITMLKSFCEHARHLRAHPTGNNWLAMEMNGLFHTSVLFPEFREAAEWQSYSSGRLYEEMELQVYPDGAQVELATGYHGVSLINFLGTYNIAKHNNIELPGDYMQRMERQYAYYMYIMMPDGRMPALNDAGWGNVRGSLANGFSHFPERTDFQYLATSGSQGTAPAFTSHWMPYAGWAIMRSGWEADDLYMHFEVGPFGAGHQHEDKLSMIASAYGRRLLTEGGIYAYDSSAWRRYVLSARAHNLVMVDNMEQHRRSKRETYLSTEPMTNRWLTNDLFDFAEGWYNEGFGPQNDQTVTHYRAVLFLKPECWLVWDLFTPTDDGDHRYDTVFHLNNQDATLDEESLAVVGADPDLANLAIVPLRREGLAVDVIKGQTEPEVQGWVANSTRDEDVAPVPTPIYHRQATGQWLEPWLLYPLRANDKSPVAAIEFDQANNSCSITLNDGRKIVATVTIGKDAISAVSVKTFDNTGALAKTAVVQ